MRPPQLILTYKGGDDLGLGSKMKYIFIILVAFVVMIIAFVAFYICTKKEISHFDEESLKDTLWKLENDTSYGQTTLDRT